MPIWLSPLLVSSSSRSIKRAISLAFAIFNCSLHLHEALTILITKINLRKNPLIGTICFDALQMPTVSNVQNNGCSKYMSNHLKSKLAIHSTYLTCCLLHHILVLEYFVYLSNVEITKNISPSLESKPQCQQHE